MLQRTLRFTLSALLLASVTPAQARILGIGALDCKTVTDLSVEGRAADWGIGYMSADSEVYPIVDKDLLDEPHVVARFAHDFDRVDGTANGTHFQATLINFIGNYCRAHPRYKVEDAVERFMYTNLRSETYTPRPRKTK